MRLGEWIKQYRKERGLSMQRFADMCGFSKAYIGQLEKGINPKTKKPMSPTMQTFTKIANSVGMSVDQLLEKLDDDQPVSIPKNAAPAPAEPPTGLTARDERDIERRLDAIMNDLVPGTGLAFYDGKELTEKERDLLRISLKNSMELVRSMAKERFTPKKYKK